MLSKRILVLMFVLLFLPLVGCFPAPTPPNETPILTSDPITVATVGMLYAYDVNATDPDGDTLTYSLAVKPGGMSINSANGVINWTPVPTQVGDNPVVVKVSDGSLSITQNFTIKVSKPSPTPINHAPDIYSTPVTTATVGVTYVYDVNATDPDGDTLTYSLTTKPPGMVINPANGLISWIPTSVQTGYNWVVIVSVSDGDLSDFQGFNIVVSEPTPTPINQKPVINSYPITTAIVGETYTYTIYAFDPDGDILTYSVIDVKPIGMTINSANGFIWWIPTSTQIGDNLITVMVSDGALSDTQSFIVKVSEPEPEPEPEPGLTEIIVDPKVMDLIVGGFETFEVTAHYDNGTTNIVTFKCIYGTSNHNIAYVAHGIDKVTTLAVGTATIFINYTQYNSLTGEEITRTDSIKVTVGNTITIRWLEDGTRYYPDDTPCGEPWTDSPIPSYHDGNNYVPTIEPATLIQDDGGWYFADVNDFYNIILDDIVGSVVIDREGQLTVDTTYTSLGSGLTIKEHIEGEVEIIIGEIIDWSGVIPVVSEDPGDYDGIMAGTCTQKGYAFLEGTEEDIHAYYKKAVLAPELGTGWWFIAYTIYTAHGGK